MEKENLHIFTIPFSVFKSILFSFNYLSKLNGGQDKIWFFVEYQIDIKCAIGLLCIKDVWETNHMLK